MEVLCTRPNCPKPRNQCLDLDDPNKLTSIEQKYCTACGMPLILGGRYLPLKLLGQGGFGAAFLAFDRHRTKIKCVVKQFQPSMKLSPAALEMAKNLFIREADVLEDLGNRHLQIPDLYAFFPLRVKNQLTGNEDQFFYLVQEYVDGNNLEEILADRQQPFSESEVTDLLKEMLGVLKFVHDNGSIHRDIKPSNIMKGRNGLLYLLDFGAVKQATNTPDNPAIKSTTIYSAGFAPPEQQSGQQVSPATDLYALAATCVTLLTNRDPDHLYDPGEKIWRWQQFAPGVSPKFAAILDRMLRANIIERFRSCQEVLEVLNPPPVPPTVTIPPPPPAKVHNQPPAPRVSRFTLTEIIAGAGFIGFEGALLSIALGSLLAKGGFILALMLVAGLVVALYKRVIEGKDLPILAVITAALLFIPKLQGGLKIIEIFIAAGAAAVGAILIAIVFRIIYKLVLR